MSRKVVISTLGGANSSVAAWLLKKQGYGVVGVIMQIWQDENTEVQEAKDRCCDLSMVDDARRVAMDPGIPYYVTNSKEKFHKNVIDYFAGEYAEGRTPNPCIACNRHVKWKSLLRRNMTIGADYIVIGHYVQTDSLPGGCYSLKTLVTTTRDQIYALYNLIREQLSHTLMFVGGYHKEEIRDMIERLGLPVAHKPGSQEMCLAPGHDYALFTEEYTGKELPPGDFVDLDGNVLGCHRGIIHYTVDQGKGLNLPMGHLVFVVEIRPETNEVVTGDNQDVFINVFRCDKLNWMTVDGPHGKSMDVLAKIRYSHKGSPCTIREVGRDMARCRFHKPIWVVTSGQAVVSYDGDYVAGGGTIIRRNGG